MHFIECLVRMQYIYRLSYQFEQTGEGLVFKVKSQLGIDLAHHSSEVDTISTTFWLRSAD